MCGPSCLTSWFSDCLIIHTLPKCARKLIYQEKEGGEIASMSFMLYGPSKKTKYGSSARTTSGNPPWGCQISCNFKFY